MDWNKCTVTATYFDEIGSITEYQTAKFPFVWLGRVVVYLLPFLRFGSYAELEMTLIYKRKVRR